jgi:hypothetical protein
MHACILLVMHMLASGTLFAGDGHLMHSVVPSRACCMVTREFRGGMWSFLLQPEFPTDELANDWMAQYWWDAPSIWLL